MTYKFQFDKVYYVSKCNDIATDANDSHQFQLTLKTDSIFDEVEGIAADVSKIPYQFLSINKIVEKSIGSTVGRLFIQFYHDFCQIFENERPIFVFKFSDIIAICKVASDLEDFQTKNKKYTFKRVVSLIDNSSLKGIDFILWGNDAKNFNATGHPILAVKNAKLKVFIYLF